MFSSVPEQLHDELNGNAIHRLENIITLEISMHAGFSDLYIWFKPVVVCLRLLPCTLIESCYRDLLIHTRYILEMVLDGYPVGHYLRQLPSHQHMGDFQCLRDTILNYTHYAVR